MIKTFPNALITGLMVVTLVTRTDARMMTVAAIFDEGGESQHEIAFKHAVEAVNRNRCLFVKIIMDIFFQCHK